MNKMYTKKKSSLLVIIFIIINIIISYLMLKQYSSPEAFIGHADQANLANLARNISEGKGFVVDNVWLHTEGGVAGNSVTHAEIYWSVYVAAIVSVFFKLLTISRVTLVLPALIFKIITSAIITKIMWDYSNKNLLKTITIIVLTGFSPLFLMSISGLSDIYVTTAIITSTLFLTLGLIENKKLYLIIAGLACGFAYGFKPSGIILYGLLISYFVISKNKILCLKQITIFVVASILSVAPYLIYNKINYNTLTAAGLPLIVKASNNRSYLIQEEKYSFNRAYNTTIYNPTFKIDINKNKSYENRFEYLSNFFKLGFLEEKIISYWLLPLFIFGLYKTIKYFSLKKELTKKDLFEFFGINLIMAGILLSTQIHFEARYWNFLIPFILYFSLIYLNLKNKILEYIILIVLIFNSSYVGYYVIKNYQWPDVTSTYELVKKHIPINETVFTANPWEFSFYTRIPSVSTPYTNDINDLYLLSKRYNTKYIVIVDGDIRNKAFLENNINKFELIFEKNDTKIYKIIN